MRPSWKGLLLLLALFAASCGSSGAVPDGGFPRDGGGVDGGLEADGGLEEDGGALGDGGLTDDGGLEEDGGVVRDGGLTDDGGLEEDGGVIEDGGAVGLSPKAVITGPVARRMFGPGQNILFEGQISDPDTPLPSLTISWRSDQDGLLGAVSCDQAGYASLDEPGLSPGAHTITLTVADPEGNSNSDERRLQVTSDQVFVDSATGLMWQDPPASLTMNHAVASLSCTGLEMAGHRNWRMPTIGELRSLVQGCEGSRAGGSCRVTGSCLSHELCWDSSCACAHLGGPGPGGCYWDAGLSGNCGHWFWSASAQEDETGSYWLLNYGSGQVNQGLESHNFRLRCVRDPVTPVLVIYVTLQSYTGSFGGRWGADSRCMFSYPLGPRIDNVHAMISLGDDDLEAFPANYGYDPDVEIFWYDASTGELALMANDFSDMLDGTILKSGFEGTGRDGTVWTGSTAQGDGAMESPVCDAHPDKCQCGLYGQDSKWVEDGAGYFATHGDLRAVDTDWLSVPCSSAGECPCNQSHRLMCLGEAKLPD